MTSVTNGFFSVMVNFDRCVEVGQQLHYEHVLKSNQMRWLSRRGVFLSGLNFQNRVTSPDVWRMGGGIWEQDSQKSRIFPRRKTLERKKANLANSRRKKEKSRLHHYYWPALQTWEDFSSTCLSPFLFCEKGDWNYFFVKKKGEGEEATFSFSSLDSLADGWLKEEEEERRGWRRDGQLGMLFARARDNGGPT